MFNSVNSIAPPTEREKRRSDGFEPVKSIFNEPTASSIPKNLAQACTCVQNGSEREHIAAREVYNVAMMTYM